MLLYIFVAMWPLMMEWLSKNRPLVIGSKKVNRNVYLVLALLPIFLILAFRGGDMGADTATYVRHFKEMIDRPLSREFDISRMEHGYLVFAKAITYLTHSGLIYQMICVLMMTIGLYSFLKEQGKDAFTFLFFYCTLGVFFFMFTGTRQCLAMSICLFSYQYVRRKKYIPFAACVCLAFFFHKSAALFAVIPFVINWKIGVFNTLVYALAAFVAGRYLQNIQMWINDALDYTYEIEYTGNGDVFLIVLLLLTVFSVLQLYNAGYFRYENRRLLVLQDRYVKESERYQESKELVALVNINFITLFFWIMRLQTRVAERPSYYFIFFSCLLFAKSIHRIKDENRALYIVFIFGFSLALYVYRLKTNFASLIPYQFYP